MIRTITIILFLSLLLAGQALAVTNTWTGATNTTYSNAGNWDAGHKPAVGEDVVISTATSITLDETTAQVASWTISGPSAASKLIIKTATIGTPKTMTFTGATWSINNVVFEDITFARTDAGGLDLTNGGANLIGDCGGNSRTGGDETVTFTASTTCTVTGNSSNASTATWDPRIPLPQDDTVISLTAGQTLTWNMLRIGRNVSFGTACNLTLANAVTSYGSVDLTGMGTMSPVAAWSFESKARDGSSILTSAGKSFASTNILMFGASLVLADAFSCPASTLTLYNGNFTDSGFSVSVKTFDATPTSVRSVTKTGNWVINQSSAIYGLWMGSPGLTWSDMAGSITILNPGTTFAGAGKSFWNVNFPAGAVGTTVTGSNTFNTVTVAPGGKLTVTAGTTQTVKSLTANGTSAAHITVASSVPGTPFTLTDSDGGVNRGACVDVTDSTATGASWFVGSGGTMDAWSDGHGWDQGTAGVLHYYQQLLENQ
jgi:hypothetical protein